ncbi:MAG TPA: hypothetical protein VMV10_19620 [Pirellulales bacterium]|nr:hypothetical protein [Pirellulales bacterium]
MVHQLRSPVAARQAGRVRVARTLAKVLAVWLGAASSLSAQAPNVHYRHQGLAPPGAIGSVRLERGGPLSGYFQPVEIRAPKGVKVSLAANGAFGDAQETPRSVGLLIAPVYRLRVSNIPGAEGLEVFPTIEVIDRLYPPPGERRRFPIPIELSEEDLQLALDGKFVTRVIYLEDPGMALPILDKPERPNWFDAGPGANPLQEADRWGRPLAVLRLGGRVPEDPDRPDPQFLNGCPPFTIFRPAATENIPAPAQPDAGGRAALRPKRATGENIRR